MADKDAPKGAESRPGWRMLLETWFLVELAGVLAVCAGVWTIYRPAGLILAGVAAVVAVERGSSG